MASALPHPYRGPHGLSETNDLRLTNLQMSSPNPILRGPLYRLAHDAALTKARNTGMTVEHCFNRQMATIIDSLEASR